MKNKKGLSDVVTTVVIIALALVAITVVWMVVQGLISSNADTINLRQECLQVGLEVSGLKVQGTNNVTVSVKRTSGSANLSGVKIYAYDASGNSNASRINESLSVGQSVSGVVQLASATKVSAVAFLKDNNGEDFDCSPPVERVLKD